MIKISLLSGEFFLKSNDKTTLNSHQIQEIWNLASLNYINSRDYFFESCLKKNRDVGFNGFKYKFISYPFFLDSENKREWLEYFFLIEAAKRKFIFYKLEKRTNKKIEVSINDLLTKKLNKNKVVKSFFYSILNFILKNLALKFLSKVLSFRFSNHKVSPINLNVKELFIRVSLPGNAVKFNNMYFDRHIGDERKLKVKNLKLTYLINIIFYKRGQAIKNLSNLYYSLKSFHERKEGIVLIDEKITISNLFDIVLQTTLSFFRIRKEIKRHKESNLEIALIGNDFLTSFCGFIQNNLSHSIKLLNSINSRSGVLFTYEELLPHMRFYYFKSDKNNIKNLAYQHAYSPKGKLWSYHLPSEKNEHDFKAKYYPSIFLAQGSHYSNQIKHLFGDDLHIVGSLKSDAHPPAIHQIKEKNILLALSVADEEILLRFLSRLSLKDVKFIISVHPSSSISLIKKKIDKLKISVPLEISSKKSADIFDKVSLIICCYSTVAIEAMKYGITSCRLIPIDRLSLFDHDDDVYEIDSLNFNNKVIDNLLNQKNISLKSKYSYYESDLNTSTVIKNIISNLKI